MGQDSRLNGLDQELETVLSTWKAPGFALAVVEKDRVVYAKGFGFRDVEKQLPVTPSTLFAIGSCSKAFTTAILGQLEEEKKFSFDERPATYIPDFRFQDPSLNEQVKVEDMVTHRTGLPRHDFSWYLFPTTDRDSLLRRVAHQESFAGLRERWYYNNFMYLAQGVIAERITGKTWEENIRERFFEPLEMSSSNLSIPELEEAEEAALGYILRGDTLLERTDYYRIRGMAPAGSINSSVEEMAHWLQVWIHNGKYREDQILPESYVSQAISSRMVVNSGLPSPKNPDLHMGSYGYGWFLSSYRGHYRVEHGGNIDGFSANTSFFPTDSIGLVVLVNQSGSALPSIVRNIVADRMLGLEPVDWSGQIREEYEEGLKNQQQAMATSDEARQQGTRPSHIPQDYTGTYTHPGYGSLELIVRNDSLIALFPDTRYGLRHYHYDVFQLLEITPSGLDSLDPNFPKLQFKMDHAGEINGLDISLEPALDHPVFFSRTPAEIPIQAEDLKKYIGEYILPGQVAKVYTKEEADTLYLFLPGQPEYELAPTGEHRFAIRSLSGYYLEFETSDSGNVNAVLFQQPNGRFRAEKQVE